MAAALAASHHARLAAWAAHRCCAAPPHAPASLSNNACGRGPRTHAQLLAAAAAAGAQVMCRYNVREAAEVEKKYYCWWLSNATAGSEQPAGGALLAQRLLAPRAARRRRQAADKRVQALRPVPATAPPRRRTVYAPAYPGADFCGGVGTMPTRFNISLRDHAVCPDGSPGAARGCRGRDWRTSTARCKYQASSNP